MKINESPFVRYPKPASRFFKMNILRGEERRREGQRREEGRGREEKEERTRRYERGKNLGSWIVIEKLDAATQAADAKFPMEPFPMRFSKFLFWLESNK